MKMITLQSFTFNTNETGEVFVDIGNAMAAPLEEGDDDIMLLQIPVFTDGKAGHIYITPNQVAQLGRSALCQEAMAWAKKRVTRK